MKILILSSTPWSTDNSFGNTYSSIFEGLGDIEFANIYCSYGNPKNNIKGKYYQIDEKSLFKNLLDSSIKTGRVVTGENVPIELTRTQTHAINSIKKIRWRVFFWFRRFLWWIGRWKSDELIAFIDGFDPDLIFVPLYHSTYLNTIILFIKKITGVKMVAYVSDDVYTLKQFSLSPLYWFDRIVTRRMVKRTVEQCEYLYVISDIQKKEYEKRLHNDCRMLTKGAKFVENPPLKDVFNEPLRLVYTGNIGAGRWKSLAEIGRELEKINKERVKAQLHIYSMTPISKKMERAINIENTSYYMGGAPVEEIPIIHADADVLVHVESSHLNERLAVRHSFSTKIVDYFHAARCIFAYGPPNIASIDYLIKNNAAVVATSKRDILGKLVQIVGTPELTRDYAQKAWECGKRNHQIENIQNKLYMELKELVQGN